MKLFFPRKRKKKWNQRVCVCVCVVGRGRGYRILEGVKNQKKKEEAKNKHQQNEINTYPLQNN
jgi:hypothetical protein